MKFAPLIGWVLAMTIETALPAAGQEVIRELAPTGKLRVGIAVAPVATPVFGVRDAAGGAHGVARDLGAGLAEALGIGVEFVLAATTGEIADRCGSGTLDIGFMPVDDERRKRVDFTPPYFVIESTYLAVAGAGIETLADVDRPEITVVGIAGSTTIRAAGRTLTQAKVVAAASVDEAIATMAAGRAQALALSRDSLPPLQHRFPGSRILDGAFQVTGAAIAVQKHHPAALAYVTQFIENTKKSGVLRRAFDAAGLTNLAIAPPASEP
jgi:polar amino acid transport system substrate-binding protein